MLTKLFNYKVELKLPFFLISFFSTTCSCFSSLSPLLRSLPTMRTFRRKSFISSSSKTDTVDDLALNAIDLTKKKIPQEFDLLSNQINVVIYMSLPYRTVTNRRITVAFLSVLPPHCTTTFGNQNLFLVADVRMWHGFVWQISSYQLLHVSFFAGTDYSTM